MLDTVKAPLDATSSYIENLAEGVKQSYIDNYYGGYYAVLIDNLDKVIMQSTF